MKSVNRKIKLNAGVWGFSLTSETFEKTINCLNSYESAYTAAKVNRLVISFYKKMMNLIIVKDYKEFYMKLVKIETLRDLQYIKFQSMNTERYVLSIIAHIFRHAREMKYDESGKYPMIYL